ncbi:Transcription initiation factor TFIID subunit 12 [Acarospora aff. strigata]|nr:Transcription initiation factor TFIID subunit 12 [Acarospora aff. strigata]
MNGNNPRNQHGTPQTQSHANLIRADQVYKLEHLSDEQKAKYEHGVKQLWEVLQTRQPSSPEYQQAHNRLVEVSQHIKGSLYRWRAQQQSQQHGGINQASTGTQQNAVRPPNQAQQGQPEGSQTQTGPPSQSLQQMPPQVIQHVQNFPFIIPPNVVAAGPTQADEWLRQARSKYAKALQTADFASSRLKEMTSMAAQRSREGRSFTQEEHQNLQNQKNRLAKMYSDNKEVLATFKHQQDTLRAQQSQQQGPGSAAGPNQSENPLVNQGAHHSPGTTGQPPNQQHMPPGHGTPHTVNSAIDAARNQGVAQIQSSMSPSSASRQQLGQVPTSQSGSAGPGPPQLPQQPLNINTSTAGQQQTNSPQTAQPHSALQGPPRPLSHQMAMAQAARSYSNSNFQQSTPQSAGLHAHPQIGNVEQTNNNVKMRIPKNLNVPEPLPVAMGPARPTMSGGPSNGAMGMMGQPAIPKHPGYVLEGEGERVLSKKKLDELVRQVTGGGEGLGGEGLTAEVEEAILQVADDFVDQVVTSACRLAKLRHSSTLEIRDIQLILERNYNIRVPGYASDEIRTVKKFQPAQGWTQKMSAVQAAKVTGGKTDL